MIEDWIIRLRLFILTLRKCEHLQVRPRHDLRLFNQIQRAAKCSQPVDCDPTGVPSSTVPDGYLHIPEQAEPIIIQIEIT